MRSAKINSLSAKHRSMARDLVAGGLNNSDLMRIYGMSSAQVSVIMHSPVFVAEVARLEDQADDIIVDIQQDWKVLAARAKVVLAEDLYKDNMGEGKDGTAIPLNLAERKHRTNVAVNVLDRAEGRNAIPGTPGDTHLHQHNEIHLHDTPTEHLRKSVFDLIDAE